jgi:uncharacterized membrane protein YedE/YeeE
MTLDAVWMPLLGGVLIGLSAVGLLLFNGRIAGVSGIVGGLLQRFNPDSLWKAAFVGGLLVGGAVMAALQPEAFANTLTRSSGALVIAGLLVGFGARLGSGCTSGHGVCGMSRFSIRSTIATVTFMSAGAVMVVLVGRVFGGVL